MVWVRALVVWVAMMAAETVHGTLRTLLLAPRLGDVRARQVSMLTGCLLILSIAFAFIRWLDARTRQRLLGVGLIWAVLTVLFELGIGLLLFHYSLDRIVAEYLPWRSGLMLLGILWLAASPLMAARVRRVPPFAVPV